MRLAAKYKPKRVSEVVGQREAIARLIGWLTSWKKGYALIITGPPGVGKSSVVHALAADNGWELIEIGPEDSIEQLLPAIQQRGLLMKRKLVVIESADSFTSNQLSSLMKASVFPIVLMVEDLWKPRIRSLRPYCEVLEFKRVPTFAVEGRLAEVAKAEKLTPSSPLASFASLADGDMRAALIDIDAGLASRDRATNVFAALKAIFRGPNSTALAAIDTCDKEPSTLMWWVAENIPAEFPDPKERSEAFDLLSRFSIHKHQNRIAFAMLAGFSSIGGKRPGFVSYRPPRPQPVVDEELCQQLAVSAHCSTKKIRQELPLLKTFVRVP